MVDLELKTTATKLTTRLAHSSNDSLASTRRIVNLVHPEESREQKVEARSRQFEKQV